MEISASHKLVLPYRSKCASLHGHNWIITVYCRSARLNADGMVVDFTRIKEVVMEKLDHQNLNEVLPFNPTAENIAAGCANRSRNAISRGTGVGRQYCHYEKDTVKDNASNDVKDHSEDKEE